VDGAARQGAYEPLFAEENENEDMGTLPAAVAEAVRACPIDARRALLDAVVVCGGGANVPGLVQRYCTGEAPYNQQEAQDPDAGGIQWMASLNACRLARELAGMGARVARVRQDGQALGWVGAALLAATDAMDAMAARGIAHGGGEAEQPRVVPWGGW
jgi:actin-related protein